MSCRKAGEGAAERKCLYMRIRLEDACCVAVDYQEKFMPVIAERERLLANSGRLLKGMQILEVPVFITTQYAKGLGATVQEITEAVGDAETFDKKSFSIYGDAAVQNHLKALGRKQVILCGIEAHICVMQSALELLDAGYEPVLVEDCISARSLNDKDVAMLRARAEGVTVTTYEALLFELMQSAEHGKFRQISNLVK